MLDQFDFSKKIGKRRREEFARLLINMQKELPFRVSSRGWCYLMEQAGHINKSQFDKVGNAINKCRELGLIPVDFVAEESSRAFSGVELPSVHTGQSIRDVIVWMASDVLTGARYYTPDWWEGEEYYIQVLVEKIDLKTLFEPVCKEYHIPIANAKGWSSILQRAEYARRFKEAESMGLRPVLLYCGDHDPDGLRISDTIRKNLEDLSEIWWKDGKPGYDPINLTIDRIGLNFDFIQKHGYTWIDNLVTGSGKSLADETHLNFNLQYVQEYLKQFGERKCEANAIVTTPEPAAELIRSSIEKYLGEDALDRFKARRKAANKEYGTILRKSGLPAAIRKFLGNR